MFTARTSILVLVDSTLSSCFQESAFSLFFLSPHLGIFDWILARVTQQYPDAKIIVFFFDIHRIDGIVQILRRVLHRTQRVVHHQIHGSRLRAIAEFFGSGFAIGEPSLEVASCPLFDMVLCFLIGQGGKLLRWLQENIEKFMMLSKRRR